MPTCLHTLILTTLIALFICGTPLIAPAQLFDGDREGLLLGIGAGYAAIASGNNGGAATGVAVSGKLGYGMWDQLTLYLSSTIPNISPSLGFMFFPYRNSPIYRQGLVGQASSEEDSHFSISGGIGYEMRENISVELMLGFIRYSDTYAAAYNPWTGEIINETSETNIITIAATFNVHLY